MMGAKGSLVNPNLRPLWPAKSLPVPVKISPSLETPLLTQRSWVQFPVGSILKGVDLREVPVNRLTGSLTKSQGGLSKSQGVSQSRKESHRVAGESHRVAGESTGSQGIPQSRRGLLKLPTPAVAWPWGGCLLQNKHKHNAEMLATREQSP